MRLFVLSFFAALSLIISFAPSASALEKRSDPANPRDDAWASSSPINLSYYNTCTGWVWSFSWWVSGGGTYGRYGVWYETSENQSLLKETVHYQRTWSNPLLHEATVGVYLADADGCPIEPPLAIQPYVPQDDATFAWVTYEWNVLVPSSFVVAFSYVDLSAGGPPIPDLVNDHPAAGPTGPQACGTCFPLNRVTRTFIYSDYDLEYGKYYCPGIRLSDGVCDVELVWEAHLESDVSVDPSSWGRVKSLYR